MSVDFSQQLRARLGVPARGESVPFAIAGGGPSQLVREHFNGSFTGAEFERYGGDRTDPNAVTSDDLIAVDLLSIGIPARAAGDIHPRTIPELESRGDRVQSLLAQWPQNRDLHTLRVPPESLSSCRPTALARVA